MYEDFYGLKRKPFHIVLNQMLLQVMLVGQPELKFKLKKPNLAQFTQRIAFNYHLTGLTKEETERYISFRLEKVGGKPDLITTEAKALVHRLSGGIPRSINILCDTALVYGFADELETIDVPVIEQVIKDRGDMNSNTESDSSTPLESVSSGIAGNEAILERLQALENNVSKLQMQMAWQLEELEQRAEDYKYELVQKLNIFIQQERERNDKLLSDHAKLKYKYNKLQLARAKEKIRKTSTSKWPISRKEETNGKDRQK